MSTLTPLEQYRTSTTEADLQAAIIAAVERLGGRWAHIRDSRGQPAEGFPDLVIAMPALGTVLFVECKGQRGRVRPAQVAWLGDLLDCQKVVTTIVRPVASDDSLGQDELIAWLEGTS